MASEPANLRESEVSPSLERFVEEFPYERRSILAFVRRVAESLAAGAVVLDVGAGDAPYRELFAHCEYLTSDWPESLHPAARDVDYVAPADALPLEDASVDAVLLTQVLEHVPRPDAVVREIARVLRPGGAAFLTVPFVWELHELPFDFWRFTPGSLERLLLDAGFSSIRIAPRNDCFSTIAQLILNARGVMGRADDGHDPEREEAAAVLEELAPRIAALAPLDVGGVLPLGWSVEARRP